MKKINLAAVALAATTTVQAEVIHNNDCYAQFDAVSTITVTDEDISEYEMVFDSCFLITEVILDIDEALIINPEDKKMK